MCIRDRCIGIGPGAASAGHLDRFPILVQQAACQYELLPICVRCHPGIRYRAGDVLIVLIPCLLYTSRCV